MPARQVAEKKGSGDIRPLFVEARERDREKVMRGLMPDSPILRGYQVFHNCIRPHMALDGRTPAEAAGIEIKGEDKWRTMIQNASRKQEDRCL